MRLIYIGPNSAALGLRQFTAYKRIPPVISGKVELERLLIPARDLAKARLALRVKGSVEWSAYKAAVSVLKPKKEGE